MSAIAAPPGGDLVGARRVSVVHGRGPGAVEALRDVSFAVGPRERVALWGRSGSGKTTLLHVLGGLVEPTRGTVEREASDIAYVFQSPSLLPHFTAWENVAFAGRWAVGPEGAPDPTALLAMLGLEGKQDAMPGELSGGEGQRVAIARALARRPALLLCDEPTGQLDSDTAERVLDAIDGLQGELDFALVVATHDPDVAAHYRRLVALADGRIVGEDGLV